MAQNFMSLKEHVQDWLHINQISNVQVIGLGKGHHGVKLYVRSGTYSEFINKYPMLETKEYKGYFSQEMIGSYIYVSMIKNK